MILDTLKKTRAFLCLDCGKCTAICPISRYNKTFSPRRLVTKALISSNEKILNDEKLWTCLTCKLCQQKCPADVDYIEIMKDLRVEAKTDGLEAKCSHGGALQSLMKIMTTPDLKQNRLEWVASDLKTSDKGEYLYFVGCLPYFDVFFSDLGANSLDIARSSVKILNFLGIAPMLLPNERCCGHDLLWTGEIDNFKRLAEHNLSEIKKSGAKKVVFSCPEGYATFKLYYPNYFGNLNFEVLHISELLSERLKSEKLNLKSVNKKVTFQDPCRLGRYLNIYEPPRDVISAIEGISFSEMRRSGSKAICCGTSSWVNCDSFSRMIQKQRLTEAKDAGADTLITACPKCQIHFLCTQNEKDYPEKDKLEIMDLTTLFAEAIT